MVDSNKNIMWVVGRQGTGKTIMKRFIDNLYSECETFDLGNGENHKILAFEMIDLILNNDEDAPEDIMIFSQENPPKLVNGKPFNPILIRLDTPYYVPVGIDKAAVSIEESALFDIFRPTKNTGEGCMSFSQVNQYIESLNDISLVLTANELKGFLDRYYVSLYAKRPLIREKQLVYLLKIVQ